MNRSTVVRYGPTLLFSLLAVKSAAPPLLPSLDDWELDSGATALWLTLAAVALVVPVFVRWIGSWRRFATFSMGCLALLMVFAISIPSLLRARVSTGGLSVGGARDIDLFRQSLEGGHLPQPTDVTSEGLFADYYFDTLEGGTAAEEGLVQPVFSWARLTPPEGGVPETFLAVGLRSAEETDHIRRPPLDLCVVLDISGSMSAPFSSYHYDRTASVRDVEAAAQDPDAHAAKLQVAGRAVAALLDHLRPDDRLAVVLFDDQAYVAKRLRRVEDTNLDALRGHLLALAPGGGTNMEAGLRAGRELLGGHRSATDAETRIVFLTDAMPNMGATSSEGLAGIAEEYATQGIHLTFVGIGVDFQTRLVEDLTKVRGANYVAVHSAAEFAKRLDREFDHLVTPWAYDLDLRLEGGATIDAVFGAPDAGAGDGRVLHVSTLFPAPVQEDAIKGGIILLRLDPGRAAAGLDVTVSFENREGRIHRMQTPVPPPPVLDEQCPNAGVRKAILLAHYSTLVAAWLADENGSEAGTAAREPASWERQSRPLHVSPAFQKRFRKFQEHFRAQAQLIQDPDLEREQKLLARLAS